MKRTLTLTPPMLKHAHHHSSTLPLLALTFLTSATVHSLVHAQTPNYPQRPLRLIVPYPAGGGVDIVARALSGPLGERLGQSIVVDNRPGAGSVIGVDLAAIDLVGGDTDATLLGTQPHVLVTHPSLPAKSVRELIALAQAKPGQITYASSGVGTGPHLAAELFAMMAGVKLNHIPYKGAAPAIIDVMGGQVQINFSTIVTAMPYAQSGRLQFLAVTSPQRAQVLPAVPTIAESGLPKYEALGWYILMVRAGTPAPVLDRIHGAITGALGDATVRERLIKDGAEVVGNKPAEAARFLNAEIARWGAVVKSAGIKPE